MGKENNRTHETPENKTVIVLMLQAGLAAPISRGNSNRPDNQSTHWFWYSDFPQIITELGARGVDSCYFKIRANDLQNDPT